MIQAVFFDIDGTLLSHRSCAVPDSTRRALVKLGDSHIKRVIATGRHSTEIDILPFHDMQFDAYITLNGQLCYDADGTIFHENPLRETAEILRLFESCTVPITLVEKDRMYINFINEQVIQAHKAVAIPLPPVMKYSGRTLYQAILYVNRDEQAEATKTLKNVEITRWNDNGIDVIAKGGSKVTGIEKYLAAKGYTREETAAFGDGENDREMLRYVHKGIAMGNASSSVKAAADFVTTNVDEDGIQNGLHYLGLV